MAESFQFQCTVYICPEMYTIYKEKQRKDQHQEKDQRCVFVHMSQAPSATRRKPSLTQQEPELENPSRRPAHAQDQRSWAVLCSAVYNQKAPGRLRTS